MSPESSRWMTFFNTTASVVAMAESDDGLKESIFPCPQSTGSLRPTIHRGHARRAALVHPVVTYAFLVGYKDCGVLGVRWPYRVLALARIRDLPRLGKLIAGPGRPCVGLGNGAGPVRDAAEISAMSEIFELQEFIARHQRFFRAHRCSLQHRSRHSRLLRCRRELEASVAGDVPGLLGRIA